MIKEETMSETYYVVFTEYGQMIPFEKGDTIIQ